MLKKLCILVFISQQFIFCQGQVVEKPNIIFIICDDLNSWVTGFNEHPQYPTPNIEALGALGTKFYNGYCNSTVCAPSRTSLSAGKFPDYTSVYSNDEYSCTEYFDNIPPETFIYPLPQYLKDEGDYFTYNIGKFYHCNAYEYDEATSNPCTKEQSWSKFDLGSQSNAVNNAGATGAEGIQTIKWASIDSNLTHNMKDYRVVDSAIYFLNNYAVNPDDYCSRPFFMSVGISKPHSQLYVPEQFFIDDYIFDFYEDPFDINYNEPANALPYNGLVREPQPIPAYSDYESAPQLFRDMFPTDDFDNFYDWANDLSPIPEIDPLLTDDERIEILAQTQMVNGMIAYLSAIAFVDEQIGRLMEALEANPEIYSNTIIVFTSDHGFTWGEKKHFGKGMLYQPVIRIPYLIADLRDPLNKTSYRPVSLVDLYPTICDLIGIPYPLFPDGSEYLDGNSLVPILENSNINIEQPVLTQMKQSFNGGLCNPQNSVVNERFHYIDYASNNEISTSGCNESLAYHQYELFEVGSQRNIDPNEWNNLYGNDDYLPVVEYLNDFIPGGESYLKKVNKVLIKTKNPCLVENDDIIKLKAIMYDSNGVIVPTASFSSYTFQWSNNLTTATHFGTSYNFNMSTVSSAEFAIQDKIIFYLEVFENSSGRKIGFEIKYIYINPTNVPVVSYDIAIDENIATIIDYSITGTYTDIEWSFGDGIVVKEDLPAAHTYASTGSYLIKNTVFYGNGCKLNFNQSIIIGGKISDDESSQISEMFSPNNKVKLFPNPSTGVFYISVENKILNGKLNIYNSIGVLVYSKLMSQELIEVELDNLPNGNYLIELKSGDELYYSTHIELLK